MQWYAYVGWGLARNLGHLIPFKPPLYYCVTIPVGSKIKYRGQYRWTDIYDNEKGMWRRKFIREK